MRSVTVQEAKSQLSRLLRDVERGEQIEIRRGRTPVAVLSGPAAQTVELASLRNRFAGAIELAEDFDELDDETARAFGLTD